MHAMKHEVVMIPKTGCSDGQISNQIPHSNLKSFKK